MEGEIVNRVAKSGIVNLDLEIFLEGLDLAQIDILDLMGDELILREKPFRELLKSFDWNKYQDKWVAIHTSEEAIIPSWAYMLIGSHLSGIAKKVAFGSADSLRTKYILDNIDNIDLSLYTDERVIIKGCGNVPIPDAAYIAITQKLTPVVKSLMYGEACSSVPVFKKKKN